MVTIPSHGWFVTLYPRFSPSNHGFSNDWIGFTTKVSDFPWANPLIHRFSWFPESTSWMIFGCSEFQIELALHCRFHGCYGHGREEEEGGRSPVQPSRPLCWRSHLQVPRSRDWRSDVCVHGTIWSIVVNLEVGKSWRKIWLSAMSRCSFNVCCLAQLWWAEKLSMAWNDCMCVIDTNVWIKFGGVSGLKLHQVMAWKHRCSWQKVGALFSELWESDCCSGEELPDWRHQASSVFWCDGQGASFLALFVDWCSAACGATSLPAPSHGFRQQVQSFADGGGICQLVRLCLWPWWHWGDQYRSKQNSVSDSRWRRRLFWRLGHWCSC